jgi:hypothetical protein
MAKGRALHIGLNHIDPKHYGTDGELFGCHNDARDMQALAHELGYESTVLLDEDATVEGVQEQLQASATALGSGDIFLLTYSGHGGQVPDTNGDEETDTLDAPGDQSDETWCLYNRMLVDDELYALFAGFAPGVRIAVFSDSCHSGTVTRAIHLGGRSLSPRILEHVYRANTKLYDDIQRSVPSRDQAEVNACVILISGCQDDQTSADGDKNGLFTEHLKTVWDGGAFQGSLQQLQEGIVTTMPSDQTPNYTVVGTHEPDFEEAQALDI